MSRRSPHPRPYSTASDASDTTYYSFSRAEVYEPTAPCDSGNEAEKLPASYGMRRQDSGYESMTPAGPPIYSRRRSSTSGTSSASQSRHRPSARRAPKSGPAVYVGRDSIQPVRSPACCQTYRPREVGTVRIPDPATEQHGQPPTGRGDCDLSASHAATYPTDSDCIPGDGSRPSCLETCPPQTTLYWTSDRTRRLEYAAIDAASRGVRGWVMRHMVPDCIIPEDYRRVRFDDDRGSVVRYRLDLEDHEKSQSKGGSGGMKKRKSWWFGTKPN